MTSILSAVFKCPAGKARSIVKPSAKAASKAQTPAPKVFASPPAAKVRPSSSPPATRTGPAVGTANPQAAAAPSVPLRWSKLSVAPAPAAKHDDEEAVSRISAFGIIPDGSSHASL